MYVCMYVCIWYTAGPYRHGMACPPDADGGDGLQIWRVAVYVLNRQSLTTDKERSSSFGVGRGVKTLTVKDQLVSKYHTGPRTQALCSR
jgi:hypothetical protein